MSLVMVIIKIKQPEMTERLDCFVTSFLAMTMCASRHCEVRSNLVKLNISMLREHVIGRNEAIQKKRNQLDCFDNKLSRNDGKQNTFLARSPQLDWRSNPVHNR